MKSRLGTVGRGEGEKEWKLLPTTSRDAVCGLVRQQNWTLTVRGGARQARSLQLGEELMNATR